MRTKAPTEKPLIFLDPESAVTAPAWLEWFQRVYDYYDQVGKWVDPYHTNFGKIAPAGSELRDGLLAYADGTNWNPAGDGSKGYFRYDLSTTSWVAQE